MSSSVGMMRFPIYGKIKFMFQTTNQQSMDSCKGKIFTGKQDTTTPPCAIFTGQSLAVWWIVNCSFLYHISNLVLKNGTCFFELPLVLGRCVCVFYVFVAPLCGCLISGLVYSILAYLISQDIKPKQQRAKTNQNLKHWNVCEQENT